MEPYCLSVRPPYASGIIRWGVVQTSRALRPHKSVLGQRISIHCANCITVHPGLTLDGGQDAREFLRSLARLEKAGLLPEERGYLPQVLEDVGRVLGSVRLVDVLSRTQHGWLGLTQTVQELSPWTVPSFPFVWVFAEPELYENRPWFKGHGGLWRTGSAPGPSNPPPCPTPTQPPSGPCPGSSPDLPASFP